MLTINLSEENLDEKITKLVALEERGDVLVRKQLVINDVYYKAQAESYNGNGVFFNKASVNRFSISGGIKGVLYIADSPHTACHEFFQEEKFIGQSDFTTNCIAEIKVMRPIVVFDETALAPLLGLPVGYLMGPKAVYLFTQRLAKVLSKYSDGFEYLSRHTGKPCVALWSEFENGGGMVQSMSVTPMIDYSHKGKSAKDILKFQLGIRIL